MSWIDIYKKLPMEGTEVLVLVDRGRDNLECEIAYLSDGKWVTCMRGENDKVPIVSHWRFLPREHHCGAKLWRNIFTDREIGLVLNSRIYAISDPSGLPAHNLMIVIDKLDHIVEQITGMLSDEQIQNVSNLWQEMIFNAVRKDDYNPLDPI